MSQLIDKDEIKADHYFFWLSEYRTRKFYLTNTIDEFKNMVENFIHIFSARYHIPSDVIEKHSFEAIVGEIHMSQYSTNKDNTGKIKINRLNMHDEENLKYNKDILYVEYKNVLSFMEHINDLTFKAPPWEIKKSESIIDDISNNQNFQFIHVGTAFNKFKANIRPKERGQRIKWKKQKDGSILLSELNININSDLDLIVKEFQILLSSIIFTQSDKTGPAANNIIKMYKDYAVMFIKKSTGISYTHKSDTPRAIGIWLWDFVNENKCTVLSAIREMRNCSFLQPLGYCNTSDRVFSRMYSQTNECIEHGEVLPMS